MTYEKRVDSSGSHAEQSGRLSDDRLFQAFTRRDFAVAPSQRTDQPPAYVKPEGWSQRGRRILSHLDLTHKRSHHDSEKMQLLADHVKNIRQQEADLENTVDESGDGFQKLYRHLVIVDLYRNLVEGRSAFGKPDGLSSINSQSLVGIDQVIQRREAAIQEQNAMIRSVIQSFSGLAQSISQQEEKLSSVPESTAFEQLRQRKALVDDYTRLNNGVANMRDLHILDRLPENDPFIIRFKQVQETSYKVTSVRDGLQSEVRKYKRKIVNDWNPSVKKLDNAIENLKQELQADEISVQFSQLSHLMGELDRLSSSFRPPLKEMDWLYQEIPEAPSDVEAQLLDSQLFQIDQCFKNLERKYTEAKRNLCEEVNIRFAQFHDELNQMKPQMIKISEEMKLVKKKIDDDDSHFDIAEECDTSFYQIGYKYKKIRENIHFFVNGGFDTIQPLKRERWEQEYPLSVSLLEECHTILLNELNPLYERLHHFMEELPGLYSREGLYAMGSKLRRLEADYGRSRASRGFPLKYFAMYQRYTGLNREVRSLCRPLRWIMKHRGDASTFEKWNREFNVFCHRFVSAFFSDQYKLFGELKGFGATHDAPVAFEYRGLLAKNCELMLIVAKDHDGLFKSWIIEDVRLSLENSTQWLDDHVEEAVAPFSNIKVPADLVEEVKGLKVASRKSQDVEENDEMKHQFATLNTEFRRLKSAQRIGILIPQEFSHEGVQRLRQRLGDTVEESLDTIGKDLNEVNSILYPPLSETDSW